MSEDVWKEAVFLYWASASRPPLYRGREVVRISCQGLLRKWRSRGVKACRGHAQLVWYLKRNCLEAQFPRSCAVMFVAAILLSSSTTSMVAAPWRPPWNGRAWQRRGDYSNSPERAGELERAATTLQAPAPWKAPRWAWSNAWKIGKSTLPLLHRWDAAAPADTCVNLWVVWLKAIAGNRRRSGGYDAGLAYDLLPSVTRWVVRWPLCYFYPLLHHQNVALRTAYLDRAVRSDLSSTTAQGAPPLVVTLGAGFDVRQQRLADEHGARGSWAELDLPDVVEQKRRLLARAARRRPGMALPTAQLGANLTDLAAARMAIRTALSGGEGGAPTSGMPGAGAAAAAPGRHATFVCEALLIYLPPEKASALLSACAHEARRAGCTSASLCFADRLPNVDGCAKEDARAALAAAGGWVLDEESWLPKPGLARHMGVARIAL